MFDQMKAIDDVLRARGKDARLALKPLLEHRNRFVRYYAALYLLGMIPEEARPIIEETATKWFDGLSGDAGMLLDAFDSGQYKPD